MMAAVLKSQAGLQGYTGLICCPACAVRCCSVSGLSGLLFGRPVHGSGLLCCAVRTEKNDIGRPERRPAGLKTPDFARVF